MAASDSTPTDPADFATVIASQEMRVLELREELARAEKELGRLKKQCADAETHKKRVKARHRPVAPDPIALTIQQRVIRFLMSTHQAAIDGQPIITSSPISTVPRASSLSKALEDLLSLPTSTLQCQIRDTILGQMPHPCLGQASEDYDTSNSGALLFAHGFSVLNTVVSATYSGLWTTQLRSTLTQQTEFNNGFFFDDLLRQGGPQSSDDDSSDSMSKSWRTLALMTTEDSIAAIVAYPTDDLYDQNIALPLIVRQIHLLPNNFLLDLETHFRAVVIDLGRLRYRVTEAVLIPGTTDKDTESWLHPQVRTKVWEEGSYMEKIDGDGNNEASNLRPIGDAWMNLLAWGLSARGDTVSGG